jgi:hypothetical protein
MQFNVLFQKQFIYFYKAKRSVADKEQYKKVLDRPYVAPSLSAYGTCAQDENPPTSHYDYNFDEKDYKSKSFLTEYSLSIICLI